MKITFIQTGGTIDKDYPKSTKGWAFEISEPAVERVLEKLNPSFDFEIIRALKKDSMEITEEDRGKLSDLIKKLISKKIIITHGTDTMIETANSLSSIKDKTIILTGAMRPERFSNTDAAINIGMAIAAVQTLKNGIYLTMNGIVKDHQEINRNLDSGKFY